MTHTGQITLSHQETLTHVERHSPYLQQIASRYPELVNAIEADGHEVCLQDVLQHIEKLSEETDRDAFMKEMRVCKRHAALIIGMADIAGLWDVPTATHKLSELADKCVQLAFAFAMRRFDTVVERSGYALFAVGKLGSHALNYSSDIDLIAIFERELAEQLTDKDTQASMNKLTQEVIALLQDRTIDGYVFRVDLRVRPDPASTPPAISLLAALTYYETVGQNWERAALIKARFVAGDEILGAQFLKELRPFLWRKHLDFETIDDIHSIKRQMHTGKGQIDTIKRHNVKTGRGGIREIEFFVQTQQLVWGGRMPELRVAGTITALRQLVKLKLTNQETADTLTDAYYYLRQLEHRMQMVNDQQTHTIPDNEDDLQKLASFMGFENLEVFEQRTLSYLRNVHRIFLDSMKSTAPLGEGGYLVFTGSEPDPDTLNTLSRMGYQQPRTISDIIQGWHRGHRRATRSKRARQILTEIVPNMLKAMATSSHPDTAFIRLDDFLSQLPAGVQIFSLMASNPAMLDTLATVLGSAPALGETLGKYPQLLESIIHGDLNRLPTADEIEALLRPQLQYAHDYEDAMRVLRNTRSEREFQAGVALLKGTPGSEVNPFLSELAEDILQESMRVTTKLFEEKYGVIEGGEFAIIGLGKLGAHELTFGSDLDVFFIYDAPEDAYSTGSNSELPASVYYNRLSQRVISALTSLTKEGRLYEVDSRMRPLGAEGPLACAFAAFEQYYNDSAWTFERMALCKARIVASDSGALTQKLEALITNILSRGYDKQTVLHDANEMRQKIAVQFRNHSGWNIKHAAGGTIDIDFVAQTIVLCYGQENPGLLQTSSKAILQKAYEYGLFLEGDHIDLQESIAFQSELQCLLRLCTNESITRADTPPGLAILLQQRFDTPSLDMLFITLREHQQKARNICEAHLSLASPL